MYFIKLLENDEVVGAEQLEVLEYVRQDTNGNNIRCSVLSAQGIISLDGGSIYQLDGKPAMVGGYKIAVFIDGDEYSEIIQELQDEDPDDDIPASDEALTREELTAKVAKLEEMNTMLTGMLLENREDSMKASKVYSEGDLIIVNGELYKVLAKIANGSLLTVGTNVKQTTIAAEIAALSV